MPVYAPSRRPVRHGAGALQAEACAHAPARRKALGLPAGRPFIEPGLRADGGKARRYFQLPAAPGACPEPRQHVRVELEAVALHRDAALQRAVVPPLHAAYGGVVTPPVGAEPVAALRAALPRPEAGTAPRGLRLQRDCAAEGVACEHAGLPTGVRPAVGERREGAYGEGHAALRAQVPAADGGGVGGRMRGGLRSNGGAGGCE